MVSRLCDDGVQGRDGRCVENSSCFEIFLFVPVCILLLGSPAGLILYSFISFVNIDKTFLGKSLTIETPCWKTDPFLSAIWGMLGMILICPG